MKISVYNTWDNVEKAGACADDMAILAWDGEYRHGDVIEFSGLIPGRFYMVRVDAVMDEAYTFIDTDRVIYTVPFYEKKCSYNPLAFFGNRHYVSIRYAMEHEIKAYKNLAKNTFDQHDVIGVYPHATANVETRGESVFAARNAIDGVIATRGHGEWPYESWGINRRDDAEIKLDFGREVDIDRICIYTRADFPHDNWWISGRLSFSDGSFENISLDKKIDEAQVFDIVKKKIRYLTLSDLVRSDDPSPFPALSQIEVYGTESR